MEIDEYIARVRAHLAAPSPDAAETIEELRAHLEDAMGDLQLSGLAPDASAREAVRRCGPPAEIARAMLRARGITPGRRPQPSTRSLAAALLVAIAVAAVGGSAVASASVSSGGAGRHAVPLSSPGGAHVLVVPGHVSVALSHISATTGQTSLVAPGQTKEAGR